MDTPAAKHSRSPIPPPSSCQPDPAGGFQAGAEPLTLAWKLEFLAGMAQSPKEKPRDRRRALKLHARLSGEPGAKVTVSADGDLSESLAKLVAFLKR